MAGVEFEPPKYGRVLIELQRRIEEGQYPAGSMLPSEAQLVREFAVGRTTIVRALQMLQQGGWIDREHGRGSFAKSRPSRQAANSRPGLAVLDLPETAPGIRLAEVKRAEAPPQVADALGAEPGTPMVMRRWARDHDGRPAQLVTYWFPLPLASGTDLQEPTPLQVGVRSHLRNLQQLRLDHIAERLTARLPTGTEAELLEIDNSAPVLGIVTTVHDAAGGAYFAVEVALPGSLHQLEATYPITN